MDDPTGLMQVGGAATGAAFVMALVKLLQVIFGFVRPPTDSNAAIVTELGKVRADLSEDIAAAQAPIILELREARRQIRLLDRRHHTTNNRLATMQFNSELIAGHLEVTLVHGIDERTDPDGKPDPDEELDESGT